MLACSRTWFGNITVEQSAIRVKNYPGMEGAFSIRACYGCLDPDCARACPTNALTPRKGGGVEFSPEKCTHCGDCVKACAPGALQWNSLQKVPIVCHQCGVCVQFCPNGVLAMEEMASEEVVG